VALPATLLFSKVSVLHLRYLEAISPRSPPLSHSAHVADRGCGHAPRGRSRLVAGSRSSRCTPHCPSRDTADHLITTLAAAAAALAVAGALARGGRARPLTAAAGVLRSSRCSRPTAKSAIVADQGQTDQAARLHASGSGRQDGELSRSADAGDRYEAATAFYATAGR